MDSCLPGLSGQRILSRPSRMVVVADGGGGGWVVAVAVVEERPEAGGRLDRDTSQAETFWLGVALPVSMCVYSFVFADSVYVLHDLWSPSAMRRIVSRPCLPVPTVSALFRTIFFYFLHLSFLASAEPLGETTESKPQH